MLVLLPPSETKRLGGDRAHDATSLAHHARLARTRTRVRSALVAASRSEAAAVKALKLGVKNRDERLLNLQLDTSGAMPAVERYTGVLYDALDVRSLGGEARGWIEAHVAIQSALFGLLDAGDEIPAYRLSGSSRLPKLAAPLAKLWAPVHEGVLSGAAVRGSTTPRPVVDYALDLRSKDYAALAPLARLGAESFDFVEVVARGDAGEVRALNHFNKAAKGELVRKLASTLAAGGTIANREELFAWAAANDIDLMPGEDPHTVRLVTEQVVPAASR